MLEERLVPSGSAAGLARGAHAVTVGAVGDSYTDEYRFYPPDRALARNWVEILAATRRVSFGPFTTHRRAEPRDQGFAFNWARSDSTSVQMVGNQLPGLAVQAARGQVRYAWIFTGGNDFLYFLRDNAQTATNPLAPPMLQQLSALEARVEADFTTAVHSLLASSPRVRVVVATLPDVAALPIVQEGLALFPQARPLVGAVGQEIQRYNTLIRQTAAVNPRIALADIAAQAGLLQSAGTSARFGGTTINLTTPGDNYHDFFLADGIHLGTVGQGIIADAFISAVDSRFGAHIKPLSPTQIVRFARHFGPRGR
jgi:phospholipase/lecithinase/hemolysin